MLAAVLEAHNGKIADIKSEASACAPTGAVITTKVVDICKVASKSA
jgi:hypothetical protein